jgi:hypothetical protein
LHPQKWPPLQNEMGGGTNEEDERGWSGLLMDLDGKSSSAVLEYISVFLIHFSASMKYGKRPSLSSFLYHHHFQHENSFLDWNLDLTLYNQKQKLATNCILVLV